jgi:hypothetical protein
MTKYWFRQKRFGYGATPNTWQGWLFTLISVGLIAGVVWYLRRIPHNSPDTFWAIGALLVVLIPFVWISYIKTEGGWRWRSGGDEN